MKTEEKTDPDIGLASWPPMVHIVSTVIRAKVPSGAKALCGARVVGIDPPDPSWPVCKKCARLSNAYRSD